MSRYRAAIWIDPKGYWWVDRSRYFPVDDPLRRKKGLTLESVTIRTKGITIADHSIPSESSTDHYDPFTKEPALFRIFAEVPPTTEAILTFVHRYGDLYSLADGQKSKHGPTLFEWRNKIEFMRRAVKLSSSLTSIRTKPAPGSVAAKILEMINGILDMSALKPSAEFGRHGSITIVTTAHDLWTAMLLQFVEAVIEQKQFKNCEHCGKPFELAPQVNRSDRVFCSDNCRVKAYNRRKRRAVALRKQGKTLREIEEHTKSNIDTIKEWLKEGKRDGK